MVVFNNNVLNRFRSTFLKWFKIKSKSHSILPTGEFGAQFSMCV